MRREKGNETQSEDDSIGKLLKKSDERKEDKLMKNYYKIICLSSFFFFHLFFSLVWSLPLGITTD